MSICPNPELYSAYIDNEISEPLKKEVESHLLKCESCKTLVNRYKKVKVLLAHDSDLELDINVSFRKLMIKRDRRRLGLAFVFLSFLRNRAKILITSTLCLFVFILAFILQGNIIKKIDTHVNDEESANFLPILPISCGTKKKLNLQEINLYNIDMFITSNKKRNTKVYKNFVNSFNNFSYLYSKLEREPSPFIDIQGSVINNDQHIYTPTIQIYTNLNRNAK